MAVGPEANETFIKRQHAPPFPLILCFCYYRTGEEKAGIKTNQNVVVPLTKEESKINAGRFSAKHGVVRACPDPAHPSTPLLGAGGLRPQLLLRQQLRGRPRQHARRSSHGKIRESTATVHRIFSAKTKHVESFWGQVASRAYTCVCGHDEPPCFLPGHLRQGFARRLFRGESFPTTRSAAVTCSRYP